MMCVGSIDDITVHPGFMKYYLRTIASTLFLEYARLLEYAGTLETPGIGSVRLFSPPNERQQVLRQHTKPCTHSNR